MRLGEQAFFKAIWDLSDDSPATLAEKIGLYHLPGLSRSQKSDVQRLICTQLVNWQRACFKVYSRCMDQPIPERDFLNMAMQEACKDLPEYYQIAIWAEKGSGYVHLYDPDGRQVDLPDDPDARDLSKEVQEATKIAIAKEAPLQLIGDKDAKFFMNKDATPCQ